MKARVHAPPRPTARPLTLINKVDLSESVDTVIENNRMDSKVCIVSHRAALLFPQTLLSGAGDRHWLLVRCMGSWEEFVFGLNQCVDTKKCVIR